MLNYLRMDLYRLVKGKMLWVTLGILLVMSCFMVLMMWLSTSPDFTVGVTAGLQVGVTDPSELSSVPGFSGTEIEDFTQNQTSMWLAGGGLTVILCIVMALFLAVDFTGGYVKNLPLSRRDRLAYYGEKLVLVALFSVAFLAFAVATFEVARIVAGFTYAHVGSIGGIATWFGLAVLVLTMYAVVTATITWLVRSKAAGIAAAFVVGSSMLGSIVGMICMNLAGVWEPFGRFAEWLPSSSFALLRQGGDALLAAPGDVGHILVSCGVPLVACATVVLVVCTRKDV